MQSSPTNPHRILEDLLRHSGGAAPASVDVASIIQSWSVLRRYSSSSSSSDADHLPLLSSLQTLYSSRSSLNISDHQANLLLSLLSSVSSSSASASASAALLPPLLSLLVVHLRKTPRPSLPLIGSLLSLFSFPSSSSLLSAAPSHVALLLGALAACPALPDPSRPACLDRLCSLLESDRRNISSLDPDLLAGIGYALSVSEDRHFLRIFTSLLGIWSNGDTSDDEDALRTNVLHGFMVLRLMEWCALGFIASRSWSKIELLCQEVGVDDHNKVRSSGSPFAIIMSSAGILRSFRSNRLQIDAQLRKSLEGSIGYVANKHLITKMGSDSNFVSSLDCRVLLHCICLSLTWCGSISFNASVLRCICLALVNEVFPLQSFFRMILGDANSISTGFVHSKVKEHLVSNLYKEAGAITRVLCNQYATADEDSKMLAENHIWKYSQELYSSLRLVAFVTRGKSNVLLEDLEKIAEAAFLMVVIFAAQVNKLKLSSKSSHELRPRVSVSILVAFSCVEYLRRVRLPEYTEVVRRAVLTIQENSSLCAAFVESMPSYDELTKAKGSSKLAMRYVWSQDDVQTARMIFYLRVMPTCINLIPASIFGNLVVPKMFLYMQHPNEKVARASHSVFASFISSGKDFDQNDGPDLKEQLVFYYMQRALEAYPGITPFEGLASGVAALIKHLPAGSPAISYCVHNLIEKANELFKKGVNEDSNMWKHWEGSTAPYKKILELLLHLISLVDIQVLPYLLKQLAEFVGELPKDGQNVILDEMYSQVAESDDVTRKPILVSWLQSLSFLCSQSQAPHSGKLSAENTNDDLSLNRTRARL